MAGGIRDFLSTVFTPAEDDDGPREADGRAYSLKVSPKAGGDTDFMLAVVPSETSIVDLIDILEKGTLWVHWAMPIPPYDTATARREVH